MEIFKIWGLLRNSDNIEQVRALGLRALEVVELLNKQGNHLPDNYEAQVGNFGDNPNWYTEDTGTKDYCIGFVEGRAYTEGRRRVICGKMTVYPEEDYGLEIDGIKLLEGK